MTNNFEERIERNLEGLHCVSVGICCSCEQCRSDYGMTEQEIAEAQANGDLNDEGGFSMHDCESCGSDLAGDRYAVHGIDANRDLVHLDVCCDCLFYLANGDLPN
jgi:hypothetical protein